MVVALQFLVFIVPAILVCGTLRRYSTRRRLTLVLGSVGSIVGYFVGITTMNELFGFVEVSFAVFAFRLFVVASITAVGALLLGGPTLIDFGRTK